MRLRGTLLVTAALAGSTTLAALPPAGAAALDAWSATAATLQSVVADGPHGGDGTLLTVTGPAASMTETASQAATAGQLYGARGFIRQTGGTPAVAQVTLTDSAGATVASAPIHLTSIWQTFGVTRNAAPAGPMQITVLAAPHTSLPAGTAIEVAGITAQTTSRSVTARLAGTNEITLSVNGGAANVYNPRGYLYWPYVIGEQWPASSWADAATCQTDAQMLGAEGVTVLQVPIEPDLLSNQSTVLQCADAFWAQGIGVDWLSDGLGGSQTIEIGPWYVPAYEQELQQAIAAVGNHPATQFWLVGNEEDAQGNNGNATDQAARNCYFNPCSNDSMGGGNYLEKLTEYIHTNDPGHLVGTKLTTGSIGNCAGNSWLRAGEVPSLDYWGIDAYAQTTYGSTFSCMATDDPTRPAMVTEFGNSRYYCPGTDLYTVSNGNERIDVACPQGSHESQDNQTTANIDLWNEILANEATSGNTKGELIGAEEFMYSDLWWFTLTFFTGSTGTPATHDVEAFNLIPNYPNSFWVPEWMGAAYAQNANQSGQPRITTEMFTSLGQLWQPSVTFPSISNVSVTPLSTPDAPCQIEVKWTSATPTTSRVDWARDDTTTLADGNNQDVLMNNANFLDSASDANLVTSHDVVISQDITEGEVVHVVARGFDSAWHTAATQQILVQVPLNSCV